MKHRSFLVMLAVLATTVVVVMGAALARSRTRVDESERRNAELAAELDRLRATVKASLASTRGLEAGLPAMTDAGSVPVIIDAHGDRVRELEEALARRDAELAALRAAAASAAPVADAFPSAATNDPRRSWMDDLRERDPERYKELVNRREQARQAAKYDIARKAAHFLERDTDVLSDEEAEAYRRMMDLLTSSFELTDRLAADLPREERREVASTLRDNMRELSPLLSGERRKELVQVGRDLGYDEEGAGAFADYVENLVDLTSVQSIFRNAMRGMGGWSGMPGPEGR